MLLNKKTQKLWMSLDVAFTTSKSRYFPYDRIKAQRFLKKNIVTVTYQPDMKIKY